MSNPWMETIAAAVREQPLLYGCAMIFFLIVFSIRKWQSFDKVSTVDPVFSRNNFKISQLKRSIQQKPAPAKTSSRKYTAEAIIPLQKFHWQDTEPLKLRPFKPKYHLTMGNI